MDTRIGVSGETTLAHDGSASHAARLRSIAFLLALALLAGLERPAMAGQGAADGDVSGVNLPGGVAKATATRLLATATPITLAQATSQVVYVTNCPAAAQPPERSDWPLWVALGAVLVAGAIVGVMFARQSTDLAMPTTTFGTKDF
jgi:hypothetical protein